MPHAPAHLDRTGFSTTPVWLDPADTPRLPAIAGDVRVDVVVVGAGMTGLTAAWLLKKAGKTVAVLERGRCARVDTGHTTAHVTCVTDLRLQDMVKLFGRENARAVWDAGGAATDQIVNAIRAEDIACGFRWVPGYLHAPPGKDPGGGVRELTREADTARDLGIDARFVESVPVFGLPGVRFAHQAIFHPVRYLSALARAVPGGGSHLFERSPADEVVERPLSVKSGSYKVRADYLIIATHDPIMGKAATAAALLLQTKLALYTSYALGARVPEGFAPEASFWDTADPYGYLRVEKRRGHAYAIYGGADHKTGQGDSRQAYAMLEKQFLSFAPGASIDHRWSGQVISTNDGLPLIGETAPRQFAATGFAGNGMTFGTLGAMMAVDAVLRRSNPWARLFDIHRRKLRGGTWNYVRENADYPYYMARDWLGGAEDKSLRSLRRGAGQVLKLGGRKVAAYRADDGAVTLCSPVCTHLKCIVGWNSAERTWDCPCHGSRFTPQGQVISGPAEEPLEKLPAPGP